MLQSNPFTAPCLLSSIKGQIITSEKKLNSLENRLNGPSKDGSAPIEANDILLNNMNNLKIKLFHNDQPLQVESTKSFANCCSSDSNSTFLSNKRKRSSIVLSSTQSSSSPLTNTKKTLLNSSLNKNSNRTKGKRKQIDKNLKMNDYYDKIKNANTTSLSSVSGSQSSPYTLTPYLKKTLSSNGESESSIANMKRKCMGDSGEKDNNEGIDLIINEKDRLINEKDEEINSLKQTLEEYKQKTEALTNYNNQYISDIDKCENDIIAFVKQISDLNRQILKRDINDKQYSIGKYNYQKVFNGQIVEYWEEGEEMRIINQRYANLKNEKNELRTLLSNNNQSNREMLNFRLNHLQREETELKYAKEALNKHKASLMHNINQIREEGKCSYANNWSLLGSKYQLVSLLGQGGYSEVYKAYDIKTHRYVACKIHKLNPNWKEEVKDSYIKHTIREDRIMKEITHENIVMHYDTIEIDNNSFCSVLELCSGPDLGAYIKERKFIFESEAKAIILQVLKALEYLNNLNRKIIHYDIKPQNIIFNSNMSEIKLTDFGLAKIIEIDDSSIELTSQGVGTYYYLPPECFEKKSDIKIDSKVDIWSIGVVLYEMLFGIKPFGNNCTQEKIAYDYTCIMQNGKTLTFYDEINKISNECKSFIKKCLEFDANKRYDVFAALKSRFINDSNTQ